MMLSFFSKSSPEIQSLCKPNVLQSIKKTLKSIQAHISLNPRFYTALLIAFLLIQIVAVIGTRAGSVLFTVSRDIPSPNNGLPVADPCKLGRVYVYDLPPMFNRDLVAKCDDLDPWKWQCGVASNDGYGRRATVFDGILPEKFARLWYRTSQFSSEVIFHNRMLNYRCRTMEPESAAAFYIPFYAALAVGRFLWVDDLEKRDWHCQMMVKWVQNKPYWSRSNGSDHFITLGRITWDFRRLTDPEQKWGSSFLNMPAMQNVTRFTIERAPGDDYDVGVPYPTGFHPSSDSDIRQWQSFVRSRDRKTLFTFIGAKRHGMDNDFRSLLLNYCYNESDSCRVVDCAVAQCLNGTSAILEALMDADFCLQPKGDSYTRRSVFDCMIAGSIPVFFWKRTAYDQYDWFLPGEPESYSVFIDHEDVINGTSIKGVLEKFSREEVRKMKESVIELIPKIVYVKPSEGLDAIRDAFDVAVDGVLRRFKDQKALMESSHVHQIPSP